MVEADKRIQLTPTQKELIIQSLARQLRGAYGDVTQTLRDKLPLLFEHFSDHPNGEYVGDIVLMFVQEDIKRVYDRGYRW
jgi:hypothetical protein